MQPGDSIQSETTYKIIKRIGRGTFNDVWQARDQHLDRIVAIKTITQSPSSTLDDESRWQIFEREAQLLAGLGHPNIIPVYDYGNNAGELYVVTRYISGGTLQDMLQDGIPLSVPDLFRIGVTIANALDYTHQQGVIHREIKPGNILIDSNGHPYLGNFGIAVAQSTADSLGTAVFFAPETYSEHPIDYKADIYGFGITLFQMITGHLPVKGNPTPNQQRNHASNPLESVKSHCPHLSTVIDRVLNRMTRPDPHERYTSASEAVQALEDAYTVRHDIPGKVFISYAHEDAGYVHHIVGELRNIGVDVWIDQDIPPGVNWDNTVEEALDTCTQMIVIMSPAAAKSINVSDEWHYFLEKGKVIFPLLHKSCEIPFRLRRRQYIETTENPLDDLTNIVNALTGISS